jgi:hypothetical protein
VATKPPKPFAAPPAIVPSTPGANGDTSTSPGAAPAFIPPASSPLAEAPSAASLQEANVCDLAEAHGVPREEVFGWNLETGTIVTRDGRKLTFTA